MPCKWRQHFLFRGIQGGTLGLGQLFNAIGFDFRTLLSFGLVLYPHAKVISCAFYFFGRATHDSALWVQVCVVQPLYCAGGDHHKAQTGGGDLVLIKAFPWGLPCGGREESGGPSMMNVSGKWTGHNHNGPSPYCSPY